MNYRCSKCLAGFRKEHRYKAHFAKCKGKICQNCGKVGHLACGVSVSGEEILEQIRQAASAGKKVTIHPLF